MQEESATVCHLQTAEVNLSGHCKTIIICGKVVFDRVNTHTHLHAHCEMYTLVVIQCE